jgi:predicted GH43/DUF377 family glycosyl hydrolase
MKILSLRNIFPHIPVARYNMAAWPKKDSNHTILIGREVINPGVKGEPDIGSLILVEIDAEGRIIHERTIWKPLYSSLYLEDPRALVLNSGRIMIGLTAVLRGKRGVKPFPAVVKIADDWAGKLPPVTLIQSFGPGKNLTPFTPNSFLFRPEAKDYYHKLLIFEFKHMIPRKLSDILFPADIPWALWRIGTTIPPIWVTPQEAILLIHGINFIEGTYIYSIGAAKMIRHGDQFEVEVYEEPFFTPDTLQEYVPAIRELRPTEKRVIYACGGIVKEAEDKVCLYLNVGDKDTYEVCLSLSEIKQQLHF